MARNLASAINLDNQDPEDGELSPGELSDEEWVRQQDKNLEKSKEQDDVAVVQQGLHNILPALHSGLATLKESTSSELKKKNVTFENALLLSDQNSSMTPKNTTKPKRTYRDRSHSPPPKRAKVTGGQKLAESINAVVKKLKLFREGKIELTERAVKQLVELYGSNSRLLIGGLTLLQNDRKVPIFLSLNGDNQKLWLSSEYDMLASKNT